ncbi:MAG: matrixin family metalloprotease [Verrucomicrobiales bacterium]
MDRGISLLVVWLAAFVWVAGVPRGWGSSVESVTDEGAWREAEAVCVGRAVRARSERGVGGVIRTRVTVEVLEVFKGRLGSTVEVTLRGGRVGEEGEDAGDVPAVRLGEERLIFLRRSGLGVTVARGAAGWRATENTAGVSRLLSSRVVARMRALRRAKPNAGADFTRVSQESEGSGEDVSYSGGGGGTGGLSVDGAGIPARWLAADRGEAIPYLVDVQTLPVGITQSQALAAVEQALAAWSAVTSLTFVFEGVQSFGQSAATITTNDGRIRIQLHDLYGQLSSGSVLGLGGRGFTNGDSQFATTGGAGGQVGGQEFHRVTRGYVVLQHASATMRTLSTFTEVLCHELGHVLGLAHSSENPNEADPTLREAMMYYRAHADGRGAALGAYDPPVVQKAHPPTNTPPFSFPRVMYLITAPTTPNLPGVNEVRLLAADQQSPDAALTVVNGPASAGSPSPLGTWSRSGTLVKFTPNAYYGDNWLHPASNSFFARAYYRFSDGVHCSPWVTVRVLGFQTDTFPSNGGDGLPDEWMLEHFGSANPTAGPLRGPQDDFDVDGFTNVDEFRNGTAPADFRSALQIDFNSAGDLNWPATPYEVYVVESSGDFSSWTRFRHPVLPTTEAGVMPAVLTGSGPRLFLRLRRQE